jgi:hypothetical protein
LLWIFEFAPRISSIRLGFAAGVSLLVDQAEFNPTITAAMGINDAQDTACTLRWRIRPEHQEKANNSGEGEN